MFLTTVNLAKAKSKYVLVRLASAAGTGFCINRRRLRLGEKMVVYKYDPYVKTHVLFNEIKKLKSI